LPTTKVIRDNKLKVRNIPLSIFTLIFWLIFESWILLTPYQQ
jgi:hypothetical protein